MSALNVVVTDNAVHFLTDGAMAVGGRYIGQATKAYPLPHMNAVITGRGYVITMSKIVKWLQFRYSTFDDMRAGLVSGDLTKYIRFKRWFQPRKWVVQLLIGGVSEATGKPQAFLFATGETNYDLWTVVDVPSHVIAPTDEFTERNFNRSPLGLPVAFRNLIEHQRAIGGACVVGAFGQMTTIQRVDMSASVWYSKITTFVLCRWDEKRGQRIDVSQRPR